MADARHASREEEFFRINPGADPKGRLANVADRCRQLPFCPRFPIQWLNECLNKADWKDLRHRSQGLPSLGDTMVRFYQVNFRLCFSFSLSFAFLPYLSPLDSSWGS